LSVKINGVYRTINVDPSSLVIMNALTDEVDTCSFVYETTDISEKPAEGQEIIIGEGTESTLTGYKKVFTGQIVSAPESEDLPGEFTYQVQCVDFQRLLDKHLVVEKYDNMYAGDIVKDIITKYCSGFTTDHVKQGPLVNGISFNYRYPGECLKELAQLTSHHWYVDVEKDVHFFDQFTNRSPFDLDDTQSNFDNLEITADISQLRNRIYFRGGTYLSEPFPETHTGGKEVWLLGYKPHDLSITVNGVAKTVGIENIDAPTTKDFLMNYQEKHVVPGALATVSTDTVDFTYRFEVPVLTVVDDQESIDRMKGIEGGNGIYEHIIVDKEVTTKELARQRSQADLEQYANPLISGSFTTNDHGLRSGQLLHIKQTKRNIDGDFLIRKVTMRWLTVDLYHYQVEIASKLKGIEDLLIQLFSQSRQIEVRDDEVLDKLLVLRDTVKLTDSLSIGTGSPVLKVGEAKVGYSEVG
jgi:hypothetical protein